MSKKNQNFNNHIRLVAGYHYLTYGLIVLLLISGVIISLQSEKLILGLLILMISTILGLIGFYARYFAIKAQDRAIRAEESLRFFILTGKPISKNLRLGQIIALRFASDDEFVDLAARAENENLKSKEIKQAIKNWRGDYHRV